MTASEHPWRTRATGDSPHPTVSRGLPQTSLRLPHLLQPRPLPVESMLLPISQERKRSLAPIFLDTSKTAAACHSSLVCLHVRGTVCKA